jgi:hypothetical protein
MSDIPILTQPEKKEDLTYIERIAESVDVIKSKIGGISKTATGTKKSSGVGKKAKAEDKAGKDGLADVGEKIEESSKKSTFFLKNTLQKLGNSFSEIGKSTINILNTTKDNIIEGIKTPFSLILDPLKELTGFSLTGFLTSKLTVKAKQNPSKSDLAKTPAGQATLYELNQKKKGKLDEGKDKKLFGLFNIGSGKIAQTIAKALPMALAIGAIVGGLVWAVIDGIRGAFKAKEWGVDKVSAFAGAFLAGTGSGWKNAFANAGKWALIGAGTGFLVAGPVGALVGGLLGAAIGGIVGYFGGKKVSNWIKKIGEFFDERVNTEFEKKHPMWSAGIKNLARSITPVHYIELLVNTFRAITSKELPIGEKLKKVGTEFLHLITFGYFRKDGLIRTFFSEVLMKTYKKIRDSSFGKAVGEVRDKVNGFLINISKSIFKFVDGLTGGKLTEAVGTLKELDPFGKINDFLMVLKKNIFGFVTYVSDFFGFVQESIQEKGIIKLAGSLIKGEFTKDFETFRQAKEMERGIEDTSLQSLNENMKNLDDKKAERDKEMIQELKKLNEKNKTSGNTIINNTRESRVDTNSYRVGLMYGAKK